MHRDLRERLRRATGSSEFVVAVNIDIRGFSSFFSDSSQAAAFLGSAYTRILDEYFPTVSFFKPTGDGLLLVRAVDAESGQDVLREVVASSLRLDEEFKSICSSDWLINFATPAHVGIGIARSTATRLADGDKTLDYSGYPLNLASRLMDLARPHGVLFDESLGVDLLDGETRQRFVKESVYIKGLADVAPLLVYRTADVDIPVSNRKPFGAEVFREKRVTKSLATVRQQGPLFIHRLTHTPTSVGGIRVEARYPATTSSGKKSTFYKHVELTERGIEYVNDGDEAHLVLDYNAIAKKALSEGCKSTWSIDIDVRYPVPIGTSPRDV